MEIANILTFDMTTGKLVCPGYIQLSWIDEELVWNTTEFSGISHLSLPPEDIWTPQFVQWGAEKIDISIFPTLVLSNGTVFLMLGSLFVGSCKLDMRKYPIDSHSCEIYLQPATSMASDIELILSNTESDEVLFEEHGEWEIKKSASSLTSFLEPSSGARYFALLRSVHVSRRYLFKVIHICVPAILLSILGIMIFFNSPKIRGEDLLFCNSSAHICCIHIEQCGRLTEQLINNFLLLYFHGDIKLYNNTSRHH